MMLTQVLFTWPLQWPSQLFVFNHLMYLASNLLHNQLFFPPSNSTPLAAFNKNTKYREVTRSTWLLFGNILLMCLLLYCKTSSFAGINDGWTLIYSVKLSILFTLVPGLFTAGKTCFLICASCLKWAYVAQISCSRMRWWKAVSVFASKPSCCCDETLRKNSSSPCRPTP